MQLTMMTTRLNPITTPRYKLRAEKVSRNKKAAPNAIIGKKVEIDEMLARLQALSDDHFDCAPTRRARRWSTLSNITPSC